MAEENSNERLRLFVAVAIPETVRNEMARVQRELIPLALGDVRWTNVEQLHLTLKFLGNVPSRSLRAVRRSMAEACAGVRPFTLRAKGIGFFPNEWQPRVVWVGIEGDGTVLADLQMHVERSLAPFAEKPGSPRGETTNHANPTADNSTPRGKERFLAHATLGRFQKYRRHKTEKLTPRAAALAGHVFGEWRVEELVLFRSELSADGARHAAVAVFPFSANLKV